MHEITLKNNQAVVILTADEGDIEVDVAYDGEGGLSGQICKAIALKLINDENFRDELLASIDEA